MSNMIKSAFRPTLSLIVLTRNRKHLLQRCLESVYCQQGRGDSLENPRPAASLGRQGKKASADQPPREELPEILVVDDGSTDGTKNLIRSWQERHPNLRSIHQAQRGIPTARNIGLRNSTGQIIAFIADDYRLPPHYIRFVVDFFECRPEAKIVRFKVVSTGSSPASRINAFRYEANVRGALRPGVGQGENGWLSRLRSAGGRLPATPEALTVRHELEASGGAAFRREVFGQVGCFDDCLKRAEDADFADRAREKNIPIYYNPALEIEHGECLSFRDALRKNFQSGFYQAWLILKRQARRRGVSGPPRSRLELILADMAGFPLRIFSQAQQADSFQDILLSLPFLLLFELSHGLGFGWGVLRYDPPVHSV